MFRLLFFIKKCVPSDTFLMKNEVLYNPPRSEKHDPPSARSNPLPAQITPNAKELNNRHTIKVSYKASYKKARAAKS